MSEIAAGNDSCGKDAAEIGPPSQVSEGSGAESSSGEDVDAAETTEEMAETPDSGDVKSEDLSSAPSPLFDEESDDIILSVSVDDEEPAAAEAQEHDHEAEIFAGFSLESNGIRFRGPKSGKTVRGGLLFARLL